MLVGSRGKIDAEEQLIVLSSGVFLLMVGMIVVMLIKGHHVEVGVDVLPNREGRRCYSGL